jgi:hypothetical protein
MATSWRMIDECYQPNADAHWRATLAAGLRCPFDVFEQLFHERHGDDDYAAPYRLIDWSRVVWDEVELSARQWRRMAVARGYQYAVDEARARTREEGLADHRHEVMTSWDEQAFTGDRRGRCAQEWH